MHSYLDFEFDKAVQMVLFLSLSLSFSRSNLSKVTNLCLTLSHFYWVVVLPLLVVEQTGGPGNGNDDHFDEGIWS